MRKASDEGGIVKGSTKTPIFSRLKTKNTEKETSKSNKEPGTTNLRNVSKPSEKMKGKKISPWWFVVSGLFVLIVLVGFGFVKYKIQNSSSGQQADNINYSYEESYENARNASLTGKYDQAEEEIGIMLSLEGDVGRRVELLRLLGSNSVNNKKYEEALEAYQQVEQLESTPSLATLSAIARSAELNGNKELAIEYYNKAISQLDENSPSYSLDKSEYEKEIKRIQQ